MSETEIARVNGPARIFGFDISVAEHEAVAAKLRRNDGTVLVSALVHGPRSLATPPFYDDNRPVFHPDPSSEILVPQGQSVVLTADREVSGMIWTAAVSK